MRTSRQTAAHQPSAPTPESHKLSGQTLFLLGSVVASAIILAALAVFIYGGKLWAADSRLKDIPFDGARAYDYLKQLCDLGPRPSGSEAMAKQRDLLENHFKKLGAKVEFQRFEADYPDDGPDLTKRGKKVPMANIIVRWNPENRERIALCSHYDTLPFPLQDKENKKGRFVGANDNASGVAILMELGNEFAKEPPKIGVDFVLFDGEEFLFNPDGDYFLGSEHFATDYAEHPPGFKYRAAVLMDMVGGAELQLAKDFFSTSWSDSAPIVNDIWATAARLGVREFVQRPTLEEIRDDHVPLHEKGKIPSCDLIDVSYMGKQWHTQADTAEHCSALSLAKVGWVLREWLRKQ
jgi:hypothetical protein